MSRDVRAEQLEALAAAELLWPVTKALSVDPSPYRALLDRAWQELPAGRSGPDIDAAVHALPEADADDSHDPAYLVMRAISVLSYAAEVVDTAMAVEWARGEAVDLSPMVDPESPALVAAFLGEVRALIAGGAEAASLRTAVADHPATAALHRALAGGAHRA